MNLVRIVLIVAGAMIMNLAQAATVFITGADRGLGLEFTRQYAARGDTVIATFTAALAAGATAEEAAHLANYAGGIVVMKRGTATVTQQELLEALEKTAPLVREH